MMRRGRACSGPSWGKCLLCAPDDYGLARGGVAVASVLGGRRSLIRKTAAIQTCSSSVRDVVVSNLVGQPGTTDRVIPISVLPDYRDAEGLLPAEPAGLPAAPYILYVGALRMVKGIGVLIDAWQQLRPPRPPLVLIGPRAPDTPTQFPSGVNVLSSIPPHQVLGAWHRALRCRPVHLA